MKEGVNDRTIEVENRIRQITIKSRDFCMYFDLRPYTLVNIKQCWYCKFSEFEYENYESNGLGYCKIKGGRILMK
jgi:hypothetical protein